jgi:hypothetical protein
MMNFESSVYVSELLNRQMVNAAQELAVRAVAVCARHYDFDAEEALGLLGLVNAKVTHTKRMEVVSKKDKVNSVKCSFPMPFNGELNHKCCYALRQNNGLYTQCKTIRNGVNDYCKQCQVLADKTDGVPEYGTIQQRTEVGIFEYVDPKGRKPVSYTKVMKKFNVDKEKVLEEAEKLNIKFDLNHFNIQASESKRGRPATIKPPKEVKGTKGRPKKVKKVLEINGDDDDLFATLVANANNADVNAEANDEANVESTDEATAETNDEANAEANAAANAEAEKEALAKQKLVTEKAEKAALAKQEKELLAKQKKEAIEQAKQEKELLAKQKKEAIEQAKQEKEALAKQKKEEKAALPKQKKEAVVKEKKTPAAKPVVAAAADDAAATDEPDVVKKIEIDGKKYLKSKISGIIYDYKEYLDNGEQVVIGKWNESSNKIDFTKSNDDEEEEEEEEDYDM